ncbi:hypothetical protein GCK32_009803 [Trichostrongylus colubriformis]|uniref:Uncharacterized protein n=1 Tax=Trichostrongylus colubriformis TaxID=6319 RepID=A0AAN8FQB9_TRICO
MNILTVVILAVIVLAVSAQWWGEDHSHSYSHERQHLFSRAHVGRVSPHHPGLESIGWRRK